AFARRGARPHLLSTIGPMRLYDTFTRSLVELPPPPGPVGIYWCGPTVYQRIHVGNAFAVTILPLWLKRWLDSRGYETKLVVNITDINDKIYDAAPGASAQLAADATRWYVEDTDRLGLGRPDVEPTAVETVADQIAMIEELVERGFAYESDGDVYFRVSRYPEYGRLSGQRPDHVEEQEPNPRKEDPRDFALWKANKPGEDTWWESPWGRGRPGWHIECSVMSEKHLGPEFEIHGGGLDLVFPHHENEIAQSRALGRRFARIWMHNGMLRFAGEEMHKSVGNDVSLKDALDTWGRQTLLVFFLTGHWRKPLDYTDATLTAAAAQVESFRNAFASDRVVRPSDDAAEWNRFSAALDDDFNTSAALAIMHGWLSSGYLDLLARGLSTFGLSFERAKISHVTQQVPAGGAVAEGVAPREIRVATIGSPSEEILSLAHRRFDLRTAGDYAAADQVRDELAAEGWNVRDEADGFVLEPSK
ncbi:MAG: cysteine--tRNA ligase, partial [Gaiellaceae bacterium]